MKSEGEFRSFVPLRQLQTWRSRVETKRGKKLESGNADFTLLYARQSVTFWFGVDFVEGNMRLCWTEAGLAKIIEAGLWCRELDDRGTLKAKPMTVEAAMKLPGANRR